MIVWFNTDGSVGEIVSSYTLTDSDGNVHSSFTQREGNVAAGGIFAYFEGGNPSGGLAYSSWVLPSGDNYGISTQASWERECTIALDKSRDLRKFKAEKAYEMQFFPFPDNLISTGGDGIYQAGVTDSVEKKRYSYGRVLFSVEEGAVVKETLITRSEYDSLIANVESKVDKRSLSSVVYATNENKGQTAVPYSKEAVANSIVQRDESGDIAMSDGDLADLKSKFVYKDFAQEGDAQSVQSGLCSYYTGTDGVSVNYGQNPSEFYAIVTKDSGANYAGEINLGAKAVQIETGMEVDGTHIYSFKADQNTTVLANPTTGTSTLTLKTGQAYFKSNNISISNYAGAKISFVDRNLIEIVSRQIDFRDGNNNRLASFWNGNLYFDNLPLISEYTAPTGERVFTPKKYVDDQDALVKSYAADLVSKDHEDLQAQIDAINASQNFVATYATKADMPTPPVSGLDDKDCVLVLQDESHENKAYVYKYASTGWIEVGPIGDYATSTELADTKTELNNKITALPIKSGTGAYSAKIGMAIEASGNTSIAGGKDASASGDNAFAFGRYSNASGSRSYALGASSTASGDYSYALGAGASATAERSYAIGQSVSNATANSVAVGNNFTAPTDATFSVGADNKVLLSASSSAVTASAPSIAMETTEPTDDTHTYVFKASQSETKLQSPDGASYLQLNKKTDSGYNAIFQAPSFTLVTDYASADASYISLGSDALEAKASMYYLGKTGGGYYLSISKTGATFGVSPKCSTAPTIGAHLTNKTYVDNQISALPISKDTSGTAVISGDLSVGGTFTATKFKAIEAETLDTERYTIGLAKGNTSAITSYVGLYASKYDGTNDGALVWDNTGTAYVGDASVDADGKVTDPKKTLQPLLTRAESSALSDKAILAWDADGSKAVASEYFDIGTNGIAILGNGSDGSQILVEDQSITFGTNDIIEARVRGATICTFDYNGLTLNSGTMKANELDNASGNALVRFKETEAKNVFGGVNYDAVLMGKSDRPYYSKSGSDFNGSALALASDITVSATATSDSTDVSE